MKRTVFSTNGAGKTGYPYAKIKKERKEKNEVRQLSNTIYKN